MSSESIDISQASSPGNTECDAIGAKTSEPELPASNAGRKGPGVGRKAPGVNGGAYGAYGRNLGELETGFFGSNEVVDETVKSQRIEHHRVDDLDILEEHYKIGKKLGQ